MYGGIFCHWGTCTKKQEVSVPTEELPLTCNLTQSGLQFREYNKTLYLQHLTMRTIKSMVGVILCGYTETRSDTRVKNIKQPRRTM